MNLRRRGLGKWRLVEGPDESSRENRDREGNGTVIIMSHQCKQKGSRASILNYFQPALGEPQENHSPLVAAATSHPAQDTSVTVKARNMVLKVKRKKTRRELNRAKFGKVIVEQLSKCKPGCVVQKVHHPSKYHCKSGGNSWAAERPVPKLSLNPNWVITQNRLTHHLGIFNKEVKSIDIERLLKEDKSNHCWQSNTKEPITKVTEDAMEVTSCTPLQGKEAESVTFVEQPSSSTPEPKDNGPRPATKNGCGGQAPTTLVPPSHQVQTRIQVPSAITGPAAPVADLAQKLIKTLNTHVVFPGQNLAHQTQQHLLNILVERHGGLPDTLVTAVRRKQESDIVPSTMGVTGLSRPSSSCINSRYENTAVSKRSAPRDQLIDETFISQKDSMACGFPIHSSPVMVNRLSCRKQDANACPGLRISGCFPVGPGLSEVWPQKVTDRSYLFDERQGGPSSVTDRVQTDEDTSFKHTRHQHPQMWKNASSFEMAEVNTNIFKSPPVGKRPSVTEWNLRTGSVKMLNQDLNQSKNLTQVLVPQKHMFPNAASPQFYSHTPPVQLYKTSNSLAKIWEAYQDSPCGAHWESFSREMQSPMGLNPVRETKEWRNKGQPLEDIFNVSQHKLRNIGINILGKQAKAVSCGTIWECQDDLPEGGDVGGKVGARYNHSKLPPKTQDILFEGTKLHSEQTPKEHHVVQHPRNIHHCSSLKENGLQKVCPGQYEGLLHPLELDNLSVSPSHFTCKEAADRWDRDLIKQSNLLSNSEVYKENDGHDYTQSQESQACEKAAQGWPGVNDRWACPVLETGYLSVKGTSELFEEALDHKSYLNWNGDNEHLPVSLDYPQPKAWPIPLSLYYPPSDTLEWSESPLPSWWDVPQRRTWGSTSPEVWDFPRMKLY